PTLPSFPTRRSSDLEHAWILAVPVPDQAFGSTGGGVEIHHEVAGGLADPGCRCGGWRVRSHPAVSPRSNPGLAGRAAGPRSYSRSEERRVGEEGGVR